ncbi:flagellar assembly protein FliH [Zoogloea sp.]|uniref:flagellar assembly protein FliH n=1 Tax=Zoogloea sp. TaxID=49181 RepID=UPI00261B0A81|nr:flagellar assembly protein FliH [Zoogloea sp.]
MSPHQAAGAYQRWKLPSFDEPQPAAPSPAEAEIAAPPPGPLDEPVLAPEATPAAPEEAPFVAQALTLPDTEPDIHLPTADDIERIHEEARKEGYSAGYEEGTARGRMEAMQFHGLVQGLETSLTALDREVAEEVLSLAIEVARQMVRNSLETHPESTAELIREALLQLPQAHALIHLHPDDVAMARDYLGEQLTHAGHRLVEDPSISRGGVRIDAAGSQIDATVQTRWRRIMDNLGRNIHWDGDGS